MLSNGSLRLFRVAGIQVSLHWSWLLVAVWQITSRHDFYESPIWKVAEYVGLFVIVLLHEFGHSFASKQVGGESRDILLWPFGGIAFVKVPPRPGAELWSIAAGPLVNVVLVPVLFAAGLAARVMLPGSDLTLFLSRIFYTNLLLLVFNLLPIYPLDGGQILRALLWFWVGRIRSLTIAATIGMVLIPLFTLLLIFGRGYDMQGAVWLGLLAFLGFQQCRLGFRQAEALRQREKMPRHREFACPTCQESPPGGPLWLCPSCGNRFDPFSTQGICPHCTTPQADTPCAFCGASHPVKQWERRDMPPPPLPPPLPAPPSPPVTDV